MTLQESPPNEGRRVEENRLRQLGQIQHRSGRRLYRRNQNPPTVSNDDKAADCTLKMDFGDFSDLIGGKLDGMTAFMTASSRSKATWRRHEAADHSALASAADDRRPSRALCFALLGATLVIVARLGAVAAGLHRAPAPLARGCRRGTASRTRIGAPAHPVEPRPANRSPATTVRRQQGERRSRF